MLQPIIAILGGLMAAYSLIVKKRPDFKEYLDKIRPYQEWMGVILTFWGIKGLLAMILGAGTNSSLISTATLGAELVVGFLLAYPLISRYLLEKNETARVRGAEIRNKLIKYQEPAGIALIILGILSIL